MSTYNCQLKGESHTFLRSVERRRSQRAHEVGLDIMGAMGNRARYDEHTEHYAAALVKASGHTARTAETLATVLGQGHGRCLDLGCGTGVHGDVIRQLGWQPVGVDLSIEQLRRARRLLPVALADAAQLPFADGSMKAVSATLVHTDVDDWGAIVIEAARVLEEGGHLAYVGVHPCFVGPFAVRAGDGLRLHPGYWDRNLTFTGPGIGNGIRSRVGVHHRTLADVLDGVTRAGLILQAVHESGPGAFPDLLGFAATKPPGQATTVFEKDHILG